MILLNWEKSESMYYDEKTDCVIICSGVGRQSGNVRNTLFVICYTILFIIVLLFCFFGSVLLWIIPNFLFVLLGILVLPGLNKKTAKCNNIQKYETRRIYLPEASSDEIKDIYRHMPSAHKYHLILHQAADRSGPVYTETFILGLAYSLITKSDVVPILLGTVTSFEFLFLFYYTTHRRQREKLEKRMIHLALKR